MRKASGSAMPESMNADGTPHRGGGVLPDTARSEALQKLREQWDAKLASLNEPGASDRLDNVMNAPSRLDGQVIAGETY